MGCNEVVPWYDGETEEEGRVGDGNQDLLGKCDHGQMYFLYRPHSQSAASCGSKWWTLYKVLNMKDVSLAHLSKLKVCLSGQVWKVSRSRSLCTFEPDYMGIYALLQRKYDILYVCYATDIRSILTPYTFSFVHWCISSCKWTWSLARLDRLICQGQVFYTLSLYVDTWTCYYIGQYHPSLNCFYIAWYNVLLFWSAIIAFI